MTKMDQRKIDQFLISGINWAYMGLLFFLPLLMFTRASEVFEFPKILLVYALTTAICGMWLARMVINRKILIAKTPLDIPILLFLLSQTISAFYSIEPHTSWWGYYSRFHGGLMSTICYTLLYYAFVTNAKSITSNTSNTGLSKFILAILGGAGIVSTYAILQHFGIDKDFWVQDVMNRVFSTQGQPNWLAGYLVMVIPLGYKSYKGYKNYIWLAVIFLALLWTKSRSGLIGLAVEIAMIGLIVFFNKTRKFIWAIGIIGVLGVIISIQIAAASTSAQPRNDTANQGTESGDIRKIVWKGSWELIKRYPLFGTGPETFAYTYWWTRPAEHNFTSEWNFLYNKAHNEWLNLAANTGLLGLGSHILLLGWFTAWSLSSLRGAIQRRMTIALLAGIWGVEAVNMLGFSTVTIGAYTYMFMAMAVVNTKYKIQNIKYKTKNISLWQTGGIGVIGGYLLIQIFIMFIADLGYNKGRQYADAGYIEEALPILTNVVQLMPNEPVFREELAEAQAVKGLSTPGEDNLYGKLAVDNFEIVRRQNPWQVPFLRSQGKYLFALGETDNSLYERGVELILQSIKLAPTDPRGYYQLGLFYEELGEKDKAKDNYRKAWELKPDWAEVKEKLDN